MYFGRGLPGWSVDGVGEGIDHQEHHDRIVAQAENSFVESSRPKPVVATTYSAAPIVRADRFPLTGTWNRPNPRRKRLAKIGPSSANASRIGSRRSSMASRWA